MPSCARGVVFARHNVGPGPAVPAPRRHLLPQHADLLHPPLQRRVIGLFAYALRPGGLLLLGAAEALIADARGFVEANAAQRVFRRTDEPVRTERRFHAAADAEGPDDDGRSAAPSWRPSRRRRITARRCSVPS